MRRLRSRARRRKSTADSSTPIERRFAERGELPLQISAEDDLFAKAGGGAEAEPNGQFQIRSGSEEPELLSHAVDLARLVEMHELGADAEDGQRADPEGGGVKQVAQEVFQVRPSAADQSAQAKCACECRAK